MRLDESRQRLRQHPRSAFGNLAWRCPNRRVSRTPGHGILGWLHAPRRCHQERPAVVVLEVFANHVPGGHGHAPLPDFSHGIGGQPLAERLSIPRHLKRIASEKIPRGLAFVIHAAIGFPVLFRKFRKFRSGAVEVCPLRDVASIGKRHVHDGIGRDVFEAVIAQFQFVVPQEWISLNAVMRRRTRIVLESGQRQFFRDHSAADHAVRFQNEAAKSRFGQVRCGDQAVVSGAGHHDVKTIAGCGCLRFQRDRSERQRRQRHPFYESAPRNFGHDFLPFVGSARSARLSSVTAPALAPVSRENYCAVRLPATTARSIWICANPRT